MTTRRSVRLRPAEPKDFEWIEPLLEANDLPVRDLDRDRISDHVFVGYDGSTRIGIGGVEGHGEAGLLRSVVVEESVRGRGYGTALCAELEASARREGVRTVYVLTTTASDFFTDLGYADVPRATAPERIRETAQFSALCPDSAVCLRKNL